MESAEAALCITKTSNSKSSKPDRFLKELNKSFNNEKRNCCGGKKYPSVDKRKFIKLRSFTNPKVRLKWSPVPLSHRYEEIRARLRHVKTWRKDKDS